ncbi:MAG TPA: hypothetical protein VD994_05000, partial [Prosthecobacter sp.]|nr:hypothetical protein [Prosthecobacter sp.]
MKITSLSGRIFALCVAATMPLTLTQAAPTPAKTKGGIQAKTTAAAKLEPALEASLNIEPAELSPSSTIELVFPTPMIAKERIGSKETESPLVLTPPLNGTFEWISSRSGHYRLTQAPKFNATYDFKLRPGLRDLAGKSLSTETLASAESARFRIIDQHPKWFNDEDARRAPRFCFQFNDNVTAESAGAAITFVSEDPPLTIPAKVRLATGGDIEKMYVELQPTWTEEVSGVKP